ncbi:hypothetical protein CC78DRAFT_621413 [Lojkania enalia]|uniref:Uncharacterized protein n=1 Tax=Lojkania enalia TaxID=147567 RepID=A0A9P4N1Q9_9PLEO|nr:hypothetical protein CC78DRAFT_621413 [Didymosphaeria enalia]
MTSVRLFARGVEEVCAFVRENQIGIWVTTCFHCRESVIEGVYCSNCGHTLLHLPSSESFSDEVVADSMYSTHIQTPSQGVPEEENETSMDGADSLPTTRTSPNDVEENTTPRTGHLNNTLDEEAVPVDTTVAQDLFGINLREDEGSQSSQPDNTLDGRHAITNDDEQHPASNQTKRRTFPLALDYRDLLDHEVSSRFDKPKDPKGKAPTRPPEDFTASFESVLHQDTKRHVLDPDLAVLRWWRSSSVYSQDHGFSDQEVLEEQALERPTMPQSSISLLPPFEFEFKPRRPAPPLPPSPPPRIETERRVVLPGDSRRDISTMTAMRRVEVLKRPPIRKSVLSLFGVSRNEEGEHDRRRGQTESAGRTEISGHATRNPPYRQVCIRGRISADDLGEGMRPRSPVPHPASLRVNRSGVATQPRLLSTRGKEKWYRSWISHKIFKRK